MSKRLNNPLPSAPENEDSLTGSTDQTDMSMPPQYSAHPQLYDTRPLSYNVGLDPYGVRPPSYQAAMAYPAVSEPYSVNVNSTACPVPYSAFAPQIPNEIYPKPPPLLPLSFPVRNGELPAPIPSVPRQRQGNCSFCGVGNVSRQTDLCCLICLIFLSLCTFPFGIILLCFIPCAFRQKCSHCHRFA